MSVENYFLSREGRVLSTKILKFMRSLIVKINTEAESEETKESYLAWKKYQYAYEGTDDIYAYDVYTTETCKNAGIAESSIISKNLLDQDSCYKLELEEDSDALALLNYLRKERINNYVETNSYYSQFTGKPREGQEIYVANKDKVDDTDPTTIRIESVNLLDYPATYEYVFVNGLIDTIIADNPSYYYLRYLDSPKSIYQVRNTEQFDIIGCNENLLDENELANFYKIWNEKKLYMQELMYIEGFNSRYDMYPFMMELLLLQDVFMSFFNSYMDNFALANYTDQEIFDILDSYNLSNLKKVKMSTLRKIIRQIPDLIELRGSDLIIEKLLDIVTDESVTIKRYYLSKIYPTGSDGQIKIDTSKTYEDNVNVVFKEKIIRQGATKLDEGTAEYTSFVEDDDTWGGELSSLSTEEKSEVKERFRRELLKMDFSNILTKYLTISSTVNSYTKQVKTQNLLGLLWQYLRRNQDNNFLTNDSIDFNSYQIRPIDLYAAICWFNQYFNGVSEPEVIRIHNMNISNIMALRDTGVEDIVNNMNDAKITLPIGLGDRKVSDILGKQDSSKSNSNTNDENWPYSINKDSSGNVTSYSINYKNTLVYFNPNSTISELFDKYSENIAILNALKEKWIESSDLVEAKCWDYLIQQNQTNTYFEILFDDEKRFDSFINSNNKEFGSFLTMTLNSYSYEAIYALYTRMLETFRDYMLEATNNNISLPTPNSDEDSNSADYLSDLKILFNEFLSIYTELHKIEYSQVIDDSPYNRIKLLYYFNKDVIYNDFNDKTYISDKILKEEDYYKFVFNMMKKSKLESYESEETAINNYIENFDEISKDQIINDINKNNILNYINKEKNKLEELSKKSIGGLSDEYKYKLNIYNKFIEILSDNYIHYISELSVVDSGFITGKQILIEYSKSELEFIEKEIEDLNKQSDSFEKFKTYVKFYLFESYIDKIELIHKLNYDEISMNIIDKVYVSEKVEKLKEYLEYYVKDKINIKDFYKEDIISYTSFMKEFVKIIKYEMNTDEIVNTFKDKVYISEKVEKLKEYLEYNNIENISLSDFYKEDIISYTLFAKDYVKIIKDKILNDEIGLITKSKIDLKYNNISDLVEFIKRDSLELKDTIKEN